MNLGISPPPLACLIIVPSDEFHVVAPLDGSHGDRPGLVPDLAAGGGEDDPLLSGDVDVAISPNPVVLLSVLATVTGSSYLATAIVLV